MLLITQLRHWDTKVDDHEHFKDQNVLLPKGNPTAQNPETAGPLSESGYRWPVHVTPLGWYVFKY